MSKAKPAEARAAETEGRPVPLLSKLLGEGTVILFISVLAYSSVFCYEAGFCYAFEVPTSFIIIDSTRFLITRGVFYSLAIAGLQHIPPGGLKRPTNYLFVFGFILAVGSHLDRWAMVVATVLLVIGVFGAGVKLAEPREERVIDEITPRMFGIRATTVFMLILSFFGVLFLLGRAEAVTEQRFLCVDRTVPLVVLRIYGDSMIAAEVDKKNRTLKPRFVLLQKNDPDRVLGLRRIGYLSVEKVPADPSSVP